MNKKLCLVFLIILGLFLAALLSRNAALTWMAMPFLCYLVAGILTFPHEIQLSASRTISHLRCEAGTTIGMTVLIENNGRTVPCLRIRESFSPKICLASKFKEPAGILPASGKVELKYTFQAPRGRYRWQKVQVTVSDPFGLFDRTIELPAEAEALVLPAQMPVKLPKLNPRHTLRTPGMHLSRLPGPGVDFFGVREYHPGDPLRWIHWRLSARHPKQFYSKEFEREEMADIGLILDGSAAMNLKNGSEEFFEYSIQAAAALARIILRSGNRLSLLALGERVIRVFPGVGRHQAEHILNQLAACQTGENVSLNTLKYLPIKLFPSRALIILISPLRASDFPAISRLLASGYQLLVVSPDPVEFASRDSHQPLAVRAARVERAALLWRIRDMGAQVLDWPLVPPEAAEPETSPAKVGLKIRINPHQSSKLAGWGRFSSAFLILLICGAAAGVLSGLSPAIMIAGAALTLIFWELMGQTVSRRWADDFPSLTDPKGEHFKLLIISAGIGLLLAGGGLQVHLLLPFGIVILAVLLILFSFSRFYRLITS